MADKPAQSRAATEPVSPRTTVPGVAPTAGLSAIPELHQPTTTPASRSRPASRRSSIESDEFDGSVPDPTVTGQFWAPANPDMMSQEARIQFHNQALILTETAAIKRMLLAFGSGGGR